jgi:hypothetical protein
MKTDAKMTKSAPLNGGYKALLKQHMLLETKRLKIKTYKTIILLLVLYGCETWSLTLRKEHGLRVFEKRVLRRIFGPRRD